MIFKQKELCDRCHWKDKNENSCHTVEPPIDISSMIDDFENAPGECSFYLIESYWNRLPQERKNEFNNDVKKRSKRYYSKQQGK